MAEARLVNTQTIDLTDISHIDISYISERITFYDNPLNTIVIREFMNLDDPAYFATIRQAGGSLSIQAGKRPFMMLSPFRSYVDISLPSSYQGTLAVHTVSGKIEAGIPYEQLAAFKGSSVSGALYLYALAAPQIEASTTSGKIELDMVRGRLDLHSTSGKIAAKHIWGDGHFKTISGKVDLLFEEVSGDIHASSTSGMVGLTLPPDLAFHLSGHSTSGRVDIGFDGEFSGTRTRVSGSRGESPQIHIEAHTVSGKVDVQPGRERE